MNRQDVWKNGVLVSRGIEWAGVWGRPGYTANPVRGCKHGCRWTMPDGSVAICYAEAAAERMRYTSAHWKDGFGALSFDETELAAIRRLEEPSGIFIGSMADLLASDVPTDWIDRVVETMAACPQHVFFVLTKKAPALPAFRWPPNAWIGVSVPPSHMFGKALSPSQQAAMLMAAFRALEKVDVPVRWLSAEPLAWDIAEYLEDAPISWVVIGAASNGRTVYQPEPIWVRHALRVLDQRRISVFYKGNLRDNPAANPWREEFPPETAARPATQLSLW